MTYAMRERPDGQVEIVMNRPMVVGVMADSDMAARFVAFLQIDDPEMVADAPAGFATAAADVAEAEAINIEGDERIAPAMKRPGKQLPAVVEKPVAPATIGTAGREHLTADQAEAAFARITAGETVTAVAPDYGLTMGQLRSMWAHHLRRLQKHIAEGGQQACSLCERQFTPSATNPDRCARCAHD